MSAAEGDVGGPDLDALDLDAIERHLKVLERSVPTPGADYDSVRANLEREAFPKFIAWLGPRGVPSGANVQRQLEDDARVLVEKIGRTWQPRPTPDDIQWVARRIVLDVIGTGPLQEFLDDPAVSEIMVNGPEEIVVERGGRLGKTSVRFRDHQHLTHTIRKIAERIDRRIDFAAPTLDGRLPDGSRVHAILPPLALNGPILTIRKYGARYQQLEDLVSTDTLRPEMAFYLGACVKARLNVAIGGPSASGKTTTLNVLATQIPDFERLVTIEELAELDFSRSHNHVVRLQARTPNTEGAGTFSVRQLVREALRMRADRIVVGEARGPEMLDVIQAMRCGHDGSMTTIHASAPEDVIERAVTISLFGDLGFAENSLRRMIVDALDVIVILARFSDGTRKMVQVVEPYLDEQKQVVFNEVFKFDHTGYVDGAPTGSFRWVGPSRHRERFAQMGIDLPEAALGVLT